MPSTIVIDLQPLSCMGIQVFLGELFPEMDCRIAYSKETLETLSFSQPADLVILGLNQEPAAVLDFLRQKVLAISNEASVIVCYKQFDLAYIKGFVRSTPLGLISKDNSAPEFADCIKKVMSGQTFMCKNTSEHVLAIFTNEDQQKTNKIRRKP